MRRSSVALAVAVLIVAFLAPAATAVAANPAKHDAKPVGPVIEASSTGLLIAGAAESTGATLVLVKAAGGNGGEDADTDSNVPPGRRCDPNDPRPGCQPLPKSPKK